MGKYKVNGSRHYSMFNITKGKRKYGLGSSDIYGKKLFFGSIYGGIYMGPVSQAKMSHLWWQNTGQVNQIHLAAFMVADCYLSIKTLIILLAGNKPYQ